MSEPEDAEVDPGSVTEVLVLDDLEQRVRWLEGMIPKAEITWVQSVPRLLSVLECHKSWNLVVLDYNLDRGDGHGIDAAKHMRVVGPIIIWTLSDWAAGRMEVELRKRGQNVVGCYPFGSIGLSRAISRFV